MEPGSQRQQEKCRGDNLTCMQREIQRSMTGSETATSALGSGANKGRGCAPRSGNGDPEEAGVHGDSTTRPETDGSGVGLEPSEPEANGFGEEQPERTAPVSDSGNRPGVGSEALGVGEQGLEHVDVLARAGALDRVRESPCCRRSDGTVRVIGSSEVHPVGAGESSMSAESGEGENTSGSAEADGARVPAFASRSVETELDLSASSVALLPPMSCDCVVLLS